MSIFSLLFASRRSVSPMVKCYYVGWTRDFPGTKGLGGFPVWENGQSYVDAASSDEALRKFTAENPEKTVGLFTEWKGIFRP